MITSANSGGQQQLLESRRTALLIRIHAARAETAVVLEYVANDIRATDKTRLAIQGSWKLFKAAALAAGVVWSFNASSNSGRGRRFFTLAVSMLSAMRTLRRVTAFF
ncbi:MAG: hypothetical protein ABI583_06645 [Betaproteobacteria bacterium]